MKFGTAKRDEKDSRADSSTRWIKTLKKGDTRIRFLQEHDDWHSYWEHFDPALGTNGRSYPCTGDKKSCPGCTSDNERVQRASKRYLTNALVDGYVDLYKIPASLMSKVIRRSDADEGTLLLRDFTITKAGTGLDTEYDMEREEKARIDIADYEDKFQDFEEALTSMYLDAHGSLPGEDDVPVKQVKKPEPKESRLLNPPAEKTEATKIVDKAKAKASEPVADVPPTEPQQEQAAAEEEVELSEEEVRKMSVSQLRALFDQTGIPAPDTNDTQELADALIKALTE